MKTKVDKIFGKAIIFTIIVILGGSVLRLAIDKQSNPFHYTTIYPMIFFWVIGMIGIIKKER